MNISTVPTAAQIAGLAIVRDEFNARVAEADQLTSEQFAAKEFTALANQWAARALAIPAFAFVQRFTATEYATIVTAAQGNADLAGYLALLAQHPVVNLDDPRTIGGLELLEGAGILAPGRAAQILAP